MTVGNDRTIVRSPRTQARLNGTIVESVIYLDMISYGSSQSSRFELSVSTSGNASDVPWLSTLTGPVSVTIFIRLQHDDANLIMFEGLADSIAFDPINGIARLQGRDYSSVLINSSYPNSFCNQTASEIANKIATRHGFSSNITPTSTMIGSYQGNGHNQILLNAHSTMTSEWELLCHLARIEGFEMFVSGKTLVFASLESLPRNYISIGINAAKSMKFKRCCPLSNQTRIIAKSWNSWLNQAFHYVDEQSFEQDVSNTSEYANTPAVDVAIVRPNLTSQGVQQITQRYLAVENEQTLVVEITLPGGTSLSPRDVLTINGNGPGFDTDYVVKSVRRQFSSTTGFLEYVQGYAITSNASDSTKAGLF
jgi:hypothetical protein